MAGNENNSLQHHLTSVKEGNRGFENAFTSVARMILEDDIEKVIVNGKTAYDFKIFRRGKKHIIGMYEEINSFVSYVKDAAEGGSSKEMAFVLVGEPGNGKTFFVEYLCNLYRRFLSNDGNRKYTFRFSKLDLLGSYGRINAIESQTYEDPMILAMNLFDDPDETKTFLAEQIGFSDSEIETFYEEYRPLGACSGYIWNDIRSHTGGGIQEMLSFIEIIPVPLTESLGTVTGKYPAKDKSLLLPWICWAKNRSSACSISATPTTPTDSTYAAVHWPGSPEAEFTSAMKSIRTRKIWFKSTSVLFKTVTSRSMDINGPSTP